MLYIFTIFLLKISMNIGGITLLNIGIEEENVNIPQNVNYFNQILFLLSFNILYIYIIYIISLLTKKKIHLYIIIISYLIITSVKKEWNILRHILNVPVNISFNPVDNSMGIDNLNEFIYFIRMIVFCGIIITFGIILMKHDKKKKERSKKIKN